MLAVTACSHGAAAQDAAPTPWRAAGLTDRAAARHALNRLGFGPRPGQVEEILAQGLSHWLEIQIQGGEDGRAEALLRDRPLLRSNDEQLFRQLSLEPRALQAAMRRGEVDAEALAGTQGILRQRDAQAALDRLMAGDAATMGSAGEKRGLLDELLLQKIVRATLSSQQLHESLANFWFDHFNVSASKAGVAPHLVQYERMIRSRQWGGFRPLLGAVARHPAMLHYLDNRRSRADGQRLTKFDFAMLVDSTGPLSNPTLRQPVVRLLRWREPAVREGLGLTDELGLNENWARELLELHTLGVDGGYDQWDVIEVARAFTGWTTMPPVGTYRRRLLGLFEEPELAEELGFHQRGEFIFRPDFHDAERKEILGQVFQEGGGLQEGQRVLDLLANHPSTARHLARQLVQYLVADPPPENLVREASRAFTTSQGDLRVVVWTIVQSPRFWRAPTNTQRKSPLQYVVSTLRALGAEPVPHETRPGQLRRVLVQLGQPLYLADPPTGFEPADENWFAAGPLLQRSTFAHQLIHGQLAGWRIDLVALQGPRRFDEPTAALDRAVDLLLPTLGSEERELLQQSFNAEQVPRRQWFSRALWLVLCSPEFQNR